MVLRRRPPCRPRRRPTCRDLDPRSRGSPDLVAVGLVRRHVRRLSRQRSLSAARSHACGAPVARHAADRRLQAGRCRAPCAAPVRILAGRSLGRTYRLPACARCDRGDPVRLRHQLPNLRWHGCLGRARRLRLRVGASARGDRCRSVRTLRSHRTRTGRHRSCARHRRLRTPSDRTLASRAGGRLGRGVHALAHARSQPSDSAPLCHGWSHRWIVVDPLPCGAGLHAFAGCSGTEHRDHCLTPVRRMGRRARVDPHDRGSLGHLGPALALARGHSRHDRDGGRRLPLAA